MHYDHDAPPEQTADRFIQFVDSFNSPWVGMYYDIGNHWKYGQPRRVAQRLRPPRREARRQGLQPGQEQVRRYHVAPTTTCPGTKSQAGLDEIGFTGWTTAEVGGGGLERLTTVRQQMQKAFGLG